MSKTAEERRIVCYPDPLYKRLVIAHSKAEDMTISQVVGKALKAYYDSLTENERQTIIFKSKHSY